MFIETKGLRIFIYQDPIDMRLGFERLLHFVRDQMKNDINQGHLYLFLGKNRRRVKALFFDGTGLVLIAKRIERGRFMARSEIKYIL
jgi:transposase